MAGGETRRTGRIIGKETGVAVGLVLALMAGALGLNAYITTGFADLKEEQRQEMEALKNSQRLENEATRKEIRELTYAVRELQKHQQDVMTLDRFRVWCLRLAQNNQSMKVPDPQ